jgi:hypothetical protein
LKTAAARKRKKARRIRAVSRSPQRKRTTRLDRVEWICKLAAPYLKGYEPAPAHEAELQGFWFVAGAPPASEEMPANRFLSRGAASEQVGFFVGYLTDAAADYSFLKPEPPECVIFAWVAPVGGPLHERLIKEPGSLVRKTFEYIRWLTHRPPRFVFHEAEAAAMARHTSMAGWPPEKRQHLSRNFFIETLAWLVRSGLVRKLAEEVGRAGSGRRNQSPQ